MIVPLISSNYRPRFKSWERNNRKGRVEETRNVLIILMVPWPRSPFALLLPCHSTSSRFFHTQFHNMLMHCWYLFPYSWCCFVFHFSFLAFSRPSDLLSQTSSDSFPVWRFGMSPGKREDEAETKNKICKKLPRSEAKHGREKNQAQNTE